MLYFFVIISIAVIIIIVISINIIINIIIIIIIIIIISNCERSADFTGSGDKRDFCAYFCCPLASSS